MPDLFDTLDESKDIFDEIQPPAADALKPSLWSRLLSGAGRGAVAQLSVPAPGTDFPTGQAPSPAELHATGSRFMAGTVNLPYVEHPPTESVPGAVAREAWNVGLGIPEFLGSPEGMLTAEVGGVAPRAVAGGFSALTGVQAGQQLRQLVQDWQTMTAAQRAAAVTRFGLTAGLSGVLGKQALKRPASVQPAAAAAQPEVSPSASGIREDTGLVETTRPQPEGSEAYRRDDLQQAAPIAPEPVVAREEPTTPVPQEVAKPSPAAPAPAPAVETNPLKIAWERFDNTGEIETPRDLANEIESLVAEGKAPQSLQAEVDRFRRALEESRSYGERGGIEEEAADRFTAAVEKAANKPAKKAKPSPPVTEKAPERVGMLVSEGLSESQARDVLAGRKTPAQVVQENLKEWQERMWAAREAGETGTIEHNEAVKLAMEQATERIQDVIEGRKPGEVSGAVSPTVRTVDKGAVELRGNVTKRLRDAQRLLNAESKRAFGAATLDIEGRRLISADGTWQLKYYAPGEMTPGGEPAASTGDVVIEATTKKAKPSPPVTEKAPEVPAREAASASMAETAPVAAGAEQPAKATVSQPTTVSQAAPKGAAAPAAAPTATRLSQQQWDAITTEANRLGYGADKKSNFANHWRDVLSGRSTIDSLRSAYPDSAIDLRPTAAPAEPAKPAVSDMIRAENERAITALEEQLRDIKTRRKEVKEEFKGVRRVSFMNRTTPNIERGQKLDVALSQLEIEEGNVAKHIAVLKKELAGLPMAPAKPAETPPAAVPETTDLSQLKRKSVESTVTVSPAESVTSAKGVQEVGSLSKAQLIEKLIGKRPEGTGVPSVEMRVRWRQDYARYDKLSKTDLQERLLDRLEQQRVESGIRVQYESVLPEITRLAESAGNTWRTALRAKAEQEGVRFSPPKDATRGDAIYSLSRAIAEKASKPSPPPPAEPMKGMGAAPTEGPGAATPGGVGAKAEIEQLHDAMRNVRGAKVPLLEQVKQAFDVGKKLGEAKGILGGALNGLAAVGHKIKLNWRGYPTVDALLKAKGQLSAELETRSWRARQFEREVKKNIPSARDRAAITKWIEADGDSAALAASEARVPNEFKQAYRDAANLSPQLKVAAQNVQNFFEARLQDAIDAGVLEHGVSDYIHRIYQSNPSLMKRALAYVQSGILSANPGLARKRIFKLDADAEAAGFKPVQDFLPRVLDYETSLSKAIASREFIKKLVDMDAADGRPILGVKGVGLPVEDAAGVRTGTVIKPKGNFSKANDPADAANYRGDYKDREYPSLSKWKWVGSDTEGKPIFLQGNVAIHPDYVSRIDALLKPSAIREYAIGRGALGVGAAFKQTMLDFSMFHQVQISLHAMEHRVNPLNIVKDIDFENPHVQKLLEGGVTLGGEYRATNYGEGLVGSSLSRHIPFLGEKMAAYHQFLFQDYIPRIKMTMALHALERNRARYAKDLASGRMTEDQLYSKTASQANAAFGELNYTMLERSKTIQDVARLVFLAPDFLEARTRFAAEAFTKGAGKTWSNEQRSALFFGALALWGAARVLNMLTDGQPHNEPENLFSWVIGKHAYSLRTVQGDILHLATKRLQFIMNRLNPIYTKPMFEIATKRDQFGRTRSGFEILGDTISNIMPISLRSGRERTLMESIMAGFGVNARRWNEVDRTFDLAKKWKAQHGITEPGEFIYDSQKDPLRPLKVALSNGDEADAALQIKKLVDSKEYTLPKLYQHFQRYSTMPFTGSFPNDRKFVATLSEDQKKTYEASKEYKKQIFKLYLKSVGIYKSNRPTAAPQRDIFDTL